MPFLSFFQIEKSLHGKLYKAQTFHGGEKLELLIFAASTKVKQKKLIPITTGKKYL